jgi:dienelactone hydrolase
MGRTASALRSIALALAAITLLIAATPQGRATVRAALLVQATVSAPGAALINTLTTAPLVQSITIPLADSSVAARLYRPAESPPRGGLVLALGYPANIDDPQIMLLAERMARLGILVLTPRLPGLEQGLLRRADVDILISSTQWLRGQSEAQSLRVGLMGFCAGGSLALLAAEDPQINTEVALVAVLGGYFDLPTVMRAVVAQGYREDGQMRHWKPSQETLEIFTWNMLRLASGPQDVDRIRQLMAAGAPRAHESLLAALSPSGALVFRILTGDDPTDVDRLITALSPIARNEFTQLSPSVGIPHLHAPIFLLHDPNDPYMPNTEASHLVNALRQSGNPPHYEQFGLFEHVRPRTDIGPRDLWDGARFTGYLASMIQELEHSGASSAATR